MAARRGHDSVIAHRQIGDERVRSGRLGRILDLGICCTHTTERNIFAHGAGKQNGILTYHRDLVSQGLHSGITDIDAVNQHPPARGIKQPGD